MGASCCCIRRGLAILPKSSNELQTGRQCGLAPHLIAEDGHMNIIGNQRKFLCAKTLALIRIANLRPVEVP